MDEIETLSHVDLLAVFEKEAYYCAPDEVLDPIRVEILRRMDSFTRADIALNPDEYRR